MQAQFVISPNFPLLGLIFQPSIGSNSLFYICQQASKCSGLSGTGLRGGFSVKQRPFAKVHLGLKEHPAGGVKMLGTSPLSVCLSAWRGAPILGIADIRAVV
jgi:hypothetical protein